MKRLCEVGDVVTSNRFMLWRPSKNGVYHLSSGPHPVGNEWLVVNVAQTGGGTGHGPHDVYPDGHEVTVQMLNYGNQPDPGFTLQFYQTGCFTNLVAPEEITLVRTLKKQVTTVWG